jgi:hypothetical protein
MKLGRLLNVLGVYVFLYIFSVWTLLASVHIDKRIQCFSEVEAVMFLIG